MIQDAREAVMSYIKAMDERDYTFVRDIVPRPTQIWLKGLNLSPKSKTHIRSLMHGSLG